MNARPFDIHPFILSCLLASQSTFYETLLANLVSWNAGVNCVFKAPTSCVVSPELVCSPVSTWCAMLTSPCAPHNASTPPAVDRVSHRANFCHCASEGKLRKDLNYSDFDNKPVDVASIHNTNNFFLAGKEKSKPTLKILMMTEIT